MYRILCAAAVMLTLAGPSFAQDKTFTLSAPDALVETGLLKHILPRFSLKTQVRITLVETGADAAFGDDGFVAFAGLDRVWQFSTDDDPDAEQFADWLRSDVGRNTIDGYLVEGVALFSTEIEVEETAVAIVYEGDALRGEEVSLSYCGRCHVVNEKNRMNSIGSTPSFAVLRTMQDWEDRFQRFYVLNPHPAFTQVADVTDPFDPTRPSPIQVMEMTLDDLENILTFVQGIPPADLGRPVQAMKP